MTTKEEFWTSVDFEKLVKMWVNGKTIDAISVELADDAGCIDEGQDSAFALTRDELSEPGVAVRTCINPFEPHPFISTGIHNRTCSNCKKTQVFQAA